MKKRRNFLSEIRCEIGGYFAGMEILCARMTPVLTIVVVILSTLLFAWIVARHPSWTQPIAR
jgi:hypothetical protein